MQAISKPQSFLDYSMFYSKINKMNLPKSFNGLYLNAATPDDTPIDTSGSGEDIRETNPDLYNQMIEQYGNAYDQTDWANYLAQLEADRIAYLAQIDALNDHEEDIAPKGEITILGVKVPTAVLIVGGITLALLALKKFSKKSK